MTADTIYVYCVSGPDAGALGVTIDGTAKTAACGYSASYSPQRVTYTLTSPASAHSITLTGPSSGNGYAIGAEFAVGTSGIAVHNVARSAARTEWFDTDAKMTPYYAIPNVDLVIVAIGTNDYLMVPGSGASDSSNVNAYDPSAVTSANVTTIVNSLKSHFSGASILLVGEPPSGAWGMSVGQVNQGGFSQSQYITAEHSVATAQGIAWGSWFDRYNQDPNYAVNSGYIGSDHTHPTNLGGQDMALMIEQQVFGSTGTTTGGSGSSTTIDAGNSPFSITSSNGVALQVSGTYPYGTGISVANSNGGKTWSINSNSSTNTSAATAFVVLDNTTSQAPLTILPTTANSGTRYDLIMSANSTMGWSSNVTNATGGSDTYLSRSGGVLYVNSTNTSNTSVGFYNSNNTGTHNWQLQATASADAVGAGKFRLWDGTAGGDALLVVNNTGTNFNIEVTSGSLFTWGSSATNASSVDTWMGRTSAGMLYVGSSGLGTLNILGYNSTSIPTASATTCSVGQIKSDGAYIYLCNTANHYVRAAVASF